MVSDLPARKAAGAQGQPEPLRCFSERQFRDRDAGNRLRLQAVGGEFLDETAEAVKHQCPLHLLWTARGAMGVYDVLGIWKEAGVSVTGKV